MIAGDERSAAAVGARSQIWRKEIKYSLFRSGGLDSRAKGKWAPV